MTDTSRPTPLDTDGPIGGVDYDLVKRPYFSTPFMYWAACMHEDGYSTGKHTSAHDAIKAYTDHWRAKHRRDADG